MNFPIITIDCQVSYLQQLPTTNRRRKKRVNRLLKKILKSGGDLTLGAAYGDARFAKRFGRRRAGPGPAARPLPLGAADFLLFLIRSSRVMSSAAPDILASECVCICTDDWSEGDLEKQQTKLGFQRGRTRS